MTEDFREIKDVVEVKDDTTEDATIVLFSLIVAIGCAVNGLTFGEQICSWFGKNAETIEQVATTAKIAIS